MKIWQYWQPDHWTRLSQLEPQNDNIRRDTLFAKILVIGILISVMHFLNDFFHGNRMAYLIDLAAIAILVSVYILNEKGAHRIAKILDLSMLNILIFILASVLDERTRTEYNFFPMAILAFVIFYRSELILSIIFSAVPMGLVLILEYTDYQPFGNIEIKDGVDVIALGLNILASFALLVMGLLFLVRLNNVVEKEQLETQENLRKSNEELDRFVYSASHDLRAPLRSVMGLTNLMKREENNRNMLDYIEMVDQRVTDLDSFVGDIVDHSRNSRIAVVKEVVNVERLINSIAAKLRYIEGADQITMIKDLKIHEISTDTSRLNIILTNLISNAIRYVDEKKKDQWVKFTSQLGTDSVMLTIEDNGIGIDEKHHEQIFDMFYRASDYSEGSGLGLYIVKETIQKLGGGIDMSSSLNSGTKFIISLPVS